MPFEMHLVNRNLEISCLLCCDALLLSIWVLGKLLQMASIIIADILYE